jgi:hypothetical protein
LLPIYPKVYFQRPAAQAQISFLPLYSGRERVIIANFLEFAFKMIIWVSADSAKLSHFPVLALKKWVNVLFFGWNRILRYQLKGGCK